MNLTYEEQERSAYLSGNTKLSEALNIILELQGNEDEIKDLQDELRSAESTIDDLDSEISSYDKALSKFTIMYDKLPVEAQTIFDSLDI